MKTERVQILEIRTKFPGGPTVTTRVFVTQPNTKAFLTGISTVELDRTTPRRRRS